MIDDKKINSNKTNTDDLPLFENSPQKEKGISLKPKTLSSASEKPYGKRDELAPNPKTPNSASLNFYSSASTLGPYLQEARVKAGYSLNQVAMVTKLNIHYIEALERDDYKHTPPFIYIKAYVKKLSSLYKIDEEKALTLLKPLDHNEANVPDTLYKDLQETKQTNREDEKKRKLIAKISAIAFFVIVFLTIIIGLVLSSGNSVSAKPLTAKEKAETTKNIEQLITPQSISLTKLPINQ